MVSNIQLVRFLAAFAVMAFHFSFPYFRTEGLWLGAILAPFRTYGWVGVDVFFVISGFIMWHSTQSRHRSKDILPFLYRRFARIFLGYWPWLIVTLIFVLGIRDGSASKIDWLNAITLWPGNPVLPTSWTLSYELLFYLVFAALMALPRNGALLALLGWGSASIVLAALDLDYGWAMNPLIVEFCIGAGLAAAVKRFGVPPFWISAALGSLSLCVGIVAYGETLDTSSLPRSLLCGFFGAAVVAVALWFEHHSIRATAHWILLGNASYALYLAHWPILQWGRTYRKALAAYPDLILGGLLLLCLLVSVAWYLIAERPMQRAAVSVLDNQPRMPAIS
jgi:peptidoglycan/LPS O-acetylase OafA/YrhL